MAIKTYLFLCSLICASALSAQHPPSPDFLAALDAAQIDYFEPVEQQFRSIRNTANDFFPYEWAIRKKKSKLEIRYTILPSESNALDDIPHLKCLTTASHLASNEEHSVLSVHHFPPKQLREVYRADWGGIVYFQPKTAFSTRDHCKMLALYAEGKGMALIFFLFDDPEENLDISWANLRFRR